MVNRASKKQRDTVSARRWKKYAAAAVGAVAAGAGAAPAKGEILYFNPDDVSVSDPSLWIYFDLDNSAGVSPGNVNDLVHIGSTPNADDDFHLWRGYGTGGIHTFSEARGLGSGRTVARASGSWDPIEEFSYGDSISASSPSNGWGLFGTWHNAYYGNPEGGSQFLGGEVTGYLGLRIEASPGNYRYGWAQITYNEDTEVITLHDFAIETELNTAILAGAGVPTEIPEPSSLLLAAMGGAGLLALRRRRKAASKI